MNDLRQLVRQRVEEVPVPPGDLALVRRRGGRRRAASRGVRIGGGCLAVVLVVLASVWVTGDRSADVRDIEPIGRLEIEEGLRDYANPGAEIHLGGRSFPGERLDFLDTDATATPYGMLFYDDGAPRLLEATGAVVDLAPGAQRTDARPTAKADAQRPLVAYGARLGSEQTVVVRDLQVDEVVATRVVDDDTVIEAIDDGVVLLRTDGRVTAWDTDTSGYRELAGKDTRVADLRNGVLLYSGAAPDGPAAADFRLVPGAIDATLTHDGRHVLDWSSRLEPTAGGPPVVLEKGPRDGGLGFWAFDTDGSVLVADPTGRYPHYLVHDCEVPSGRCAELGPLVTRSGDPMFIGADM